MKKIATKRVEVLPNVVFTVPAYQVAKPRRRASDPDGQRWLDELRERETFK